MGTTRRLAAIMFTDITGYSALMESDELRAKMLRNRHRDVFREGHSRYGGKILQYFGDGTLSIFDSTASAVECAVHMQLEYRKAPVVPLRIGIHTGDIAYDDEGAYGDGVNIASRLEGLCIPGGIFISAKVYDDIKNHPWLAAVSLGYFNLHNISHDMEVYAVTSKDMPYPTSHELRTQHQPHEYRTTPGPGVRPGRRKKGVAFILALFLGMWGIHRFYLGQRTWGVIHFTLALLALMMTIRMDHSFPPIAIFAMLGFLDAILLLAMPRAEFDFKYNRMEGQIASNPFRRVPKQNYQLHRTPARKQSKSSVDRGIEFYKKENYPEAIFAFKTAIEEDSNSTAAHFNLACCYSILQNEEEAFYHLAKAVELGFDDYDRILHHEALAFLRNRDGFEAFRSNNFRLVHQLGAGSTMDLLEQVQQSREAVLDKLELLGEKLERGEMTRDQFDTEKKKLLG